MTNYDLLITICVLGIGALVVVLAPLIPIIIFGELEHRAFTNAKRK